MSHYVYVGVPQWTETESAGLLGGLVRQEIGASAWQHLTSGLPDKVEVRVEAPVQRQGARIAIVLPVDGAA